MIFPGVDLIVCNYRTPSELHGFLCSYIQYTPRVPHSLHVVNVDPTTEDIDIARGAGVLCAYTEHPTNVGHAVASNEAASRGDREVIGLLNADTRLMRGTIEECYRQLLANPDWGVVGPRQVDESGAITHAGVFGSQLNPTFDGRWHAKDVGQYNEIRTDCVNVSGSAYFMRREVWNELTDCPLYRDVVTSRGLEPTGALLPTKHYYDETYTSYHAIGHGYKVVYLGTVCMVHNWHKSSKIGGYAEMTLNESREFFREACDVHGLDHE